MKAFSTKDKNAIRREDLNLITQLAKAADRKLSYLGLPSPWMADISEWKPFLSQVYAIEKEKRLIPHLIDTAYCLGLLYQLTYYWGDIDKIIQEQVDEYGRSTEGMFPVDLVNLDYCKGLDYKEFTKLSTLEAVIKRQKEGVLFSQKRKNSFPYFLLLLTHNVPKNEGDPNPKFTYMQNLTKDVMYFEPTLRKQIIKSRDWYLSSKCPASYQHKNFVLGKLIEYAQSEGFKVVPKKIIQYIGDKGAIMLHYQFQISPVDLHRFVSSAKQMNLIEILNFSVQDLDGNDIASNRPKIRSGKY
jgi:hypothetical protein